LRVLNVTPAQFGPVAVYEWRNDLVFIPHVYVTYGNSGNVDLVCVPNSFERNRTPPTPNATIGTFPNVTPTGAVPTTMRVTATNFILSVTVTKADGTTVTPITGVDLQGTAASRGACLSVQGRPT
jgi:hypothetical protein